MNSDMEVYRGQKSIYCNRTNFRICYRVFAIDLASLLSFFAIDFFCNQVFLHLSFCNQFFAIEFLQSSFCNRVFAVVFLQSSFCNRVFAIEFMQSCFCNRAFAIKFFYNPVFAVILHHQLFIQSCLAPVVSRFLCLYMESKVKKMASARLAELQLELDEFLGEPGVPGYIEHSDHCVLLHVPLDGVLQHASRVAFE